MSTTGTSLRTIWIEIRAMNYAVNTMNDVLRQLTMLERGQDLTAISCLNMAKAAMSAGILFGVLAGQVGGVGGQLLQYGSYIMYGIAAMQGLMAVIKLMNTSFLTQEVTLQGLTIEYWELFAPIIAAATVFAVLQNYLGAIPALLIAIAVAGAALALVLWSAAGGMSVLTGGTAGFEGAAGIQAASAASSAAAAEAAIFQMGTRGLPYTGLFMGHKGEVVYNPSTGRPTQIGNELAGGYGGITTIDSSIKIENLNTKMDEEELNDALKKQQRKIAMDRR